MKLPISSLDLRHVMRGLGRFESRPTVTGLRQYFTGLQPPGLRLAAGGGADENWMTVIGVVDDVRFSMRVLREE